MQKENTEKLEKIGAGTLRTVFDDQNRMIRAEAKSDKYQADLRLEPDVPKGNFSNSFGDSIYWEKGAEEAHGSYGPFEQSTKEEKTYDAWVKETLAVMQSGLTG